MAVEKSWRDAQVAIVVPGRVGYERFWALLATVGGEVLGGVGEWRFGDHTGPRIEDEALLERKRAARRAELSSRRPRSPRHGLKVPGARSESFPNAAASPERIVALDDHVAEIDADAQLYAVVSPDAGIPPGHRLLDRDRATHRIDDARKLDQEAIAGGLNDAAVVIAGDSVMRSQ
jgi:hypothetical protein